MKTLEAARDWTKRGFFTIPIPSRQKRPIREGWQDLRLAEEDLPIHFNGKPQNIGLLLGDKFGSTDVDCDCQEAITAGRELLPQLA